MNAARLMAVGLLLMCGPGLAWSAPPSIDLEVITEPGLSIEAPQKWIAMLKDVGLSNLRVRSGERGDVAEIRKRGTDDRPHYSVTGIATTANVLKLPGGNSRLGDKAAMRNWMAKLQDGGEEGVIAKKVMYGLTAKQMVAVHDELKGVVTFNTKGERTGAVLKRIVDGLSLKVVLDSSAAAAAKSDEPVADEFHGLSYGTTMAAVLRPLGFVFVPEKPLGEELQLRVTSAQSVEKPWPVGWDSPTSAGKLAPDYFKTTNAEITDYALGDALVAIQKRIGLPMVLDYNGLARQRVELDTFKVSSKKGKKSYASLVDELLYKARLKAEVRIDEAEKPFLWITTSR